MNEIIGSGYGFERVGDGVARMGNLVLGAERRVSRAGTKYPVQGIPHPDAYTCAP